MTTTADVSDNLSDAVLHATAPLAAAVNQVRTAQAALRLFGDITSRITDAATLILAMEHLAEVADDAEKAARSVLRSTLEEIGCYAQASDSVMVSLVDAPRTVIVSDIKSLVAAYPELVRYPEPQPDKKAIGDLLRNRHAVAGCSMSNGGPNVLRITTRKTK